MPILVNLCRIPSLVFENHNPARLLTNTLLWSEESPELVYELLDGVTLVEESTLLVQAEDVKRLKGGLPLLESE